MITLNISKENLGKGTFVVLRISVSHSMVSGIFVRVCKGDEYYLEIHASE